MQTGVTEKKMATTEHDAWSIDKMADLSEKEAVRDGLAHDECCHEVLHGSRLSAVRPEYERVQTPVLFTTKNSTK
jgi:hypothetical protein